MGGGRDGILVLCFASELPPAGSAVVSMRASELLSALLLPSFGSGVLGSLTDITMECVSEYNWNQGQGSEFRTASPFFVGKGGNISWNAQTNTCRGWSAQNTTLTMYGTFQPRMFFKDKNDEVIMIDMTKDTMSWTQDVSQLGKTFNGALYTSWVSPAHRDNAPRAAEYYCDANDGTGNNLWCPEMDLGEANRCGLRTTSHPVSDLTRGAAQSWEGGAVNCFFPLAEDVGMYRNKDGNWTQDADSTNLLYCGFGKPGAIDFATNKQSWVDHFGNAAYFTSSDALPGCGKVDAQYTSCEYGAGHQHAIDTSRAYHVNVTFGWDSAAKTLNNFTITLRQGSHVLTTTRPVGSNPASVPTRGGFGSDGKMGLLAQLWTSDGMSWLSAPDCKDTNPDPNLPSVHDAKYTISDIRINSQLVYFHTKQPAKQ